MKLTENFKNLCHLHFKRVGVNFNDLFGLIEWLQRIFSCLNNSTVYLLRSLQRFKRTVKRFKSLPFDKA